MPISEQEARDIYAKVLSVYPSNLVMSVYPDEAELVSDLGQKAPNVPRPAAFYSAGVLYVTLDKFSNKGMALFIITHEVCHQVFDPGSIFCGYIVWRLWMKNYEERFPLTDERELWSMQGAQNIYSDIVVNRSFWGNPAIWKIVGEKRLKDAIMSWYHIYPDPQMFIAKPDKFFKANFLQANMSLAYLEIYSPSDFNRVMLNLQDPDLKAAIKIINQLVDEKGLAARSVQKYYDVCIPLYDRLFALMKKKYKRIFK